MKALLTAARTAALVAVSLKAAQWTNEALDRARERVERLRT